MGSSCRRSLIQRSGLHKVCTMRWTLAIKTGDSLGGRKVCACVGVGMVCGWWAHPVSLCIQHHHHGPGTTQQHNRENTGGSAMDHVQCQMSLWPPGRRRRSVHAYGFDWQVPCPIGTFQHETRRHWSPLYCFILTYQQKRVVGNKRIHAAVHTKQAVGEIPASNSTLLLRVLILTKQILKKEITSQRQTLRDKD